MKAIYQGFGLLFFVFVSQLGYSQIITGTILDKDTQETLPGATVYLDGTTLSTITDAEGNFSLNSRGINNMLVVSFVGYSTYRLENPFQYNNRHIKVLLATEAYGLDEVAVGKGPFTRKQMLAVFRKQFLGESKAGKSCTILNEQDVVLYYDLKTNSLHATARNPLVIQNKYLEYEINFDLVEVVVTFRGKSLESYAMMESYFSGSTFYRDVSKNKKGAKKRKEVYKGSVAHLMKTIADNSWDREKFGLYVNGFPREPDTYFQVSDTANLKKVTLIKQPTRPVKKLKTMMVSGALQTYGTEEIEMEPVFFNVLYDGNKNKQSIVDWKVKDVYVDNNGNYSPIFSIMFGGYLGSLKAGDMLPMDYYQTIKENQND